MRKISLDELIGRVTPIAEVEYQGRVIPIYPVSALPQRDFLRLQETLIKQAECVERLKRYRQDRGLRTVDEQGREIIISDQPELGEVRLMQPLYGFMVSWLEAVMRLPEGTLANEPFEAISTLFTQLQEVLSGEVIDTEAEPSSDPKLGSSNSKNTSKQS